MMCALLFTKGSFKLVGQASGRNLVRKPSETLKLCQAMLTDGRFQTPHRENHKRASIRQWLPNHQYRDLGRITYLIRTKDFES